MTAKIIRQQYRDLASHYHDLTARLFPAMSGLASLIEHGYLYSPDLQTNEESNL